MPPNAQRSTVLRLDPAERTPLASAALSDTRFSQPFTHLALDLKDIKELIALMRKNDLSEFKLEQEGVKITLRRGIDFQGSPTPAATSHAQPQVAPPAPPATPTSPAVTTADAGEKLREISSPMVGTFYAAASPEAAPYVSVGQQVTEDTTVCIIEAMKVMNEIKAECRGVITEAAAESGKPVQFGQVLFRVR